MEENLCLFICLTSIFQ